MFVGLVALEPLHLSLKVQMRVTVDRTPQKLDQFLSLRVGAGRDPRSAAAPDKAAARDLLVRFPDVHDGWDRLGMAHEARGDTRQAGDCCRKTIDFIRQHPNDYDAGMIEQFANLVSFRAMKESAHLALQPFGQIPTYEVGNLALFESGAIVFHIAQRHAGLLPDGIA
jgi:hypothetical protein